MSRNKLEVVAHDPEWAKDYELEAQRIAGFLGETWVKFEHIGSTSIPTVYAKPILDIAILCGEDELSLVSRALELSDYNYRGRYEDEEKHYYAVLDRNNIRFCQAHVYTEETPDLVCKRMFRDVLSENVELATIYSQYKRQLAKQVKTKGEYAAVKTKWLDEFITKYLPLDKK